MREIGGYIELDTYRLPMLHDGAVALNCGRNALAYLLRARGIRRLWIPNLICDSVPEVCLREGVPHSFYSVGPNLLPAEEIALADGEWFYFVNYYSCFDNEMISEYVRKHRRVIVDQAQSYFQPPLPGVDTLYTCRKYFGVPDGAFLYTDAVLPQELPRDESFERMRFLLGRFERPASEFYPEYAANNEFFKTEPIKQMSKLTANLLHGLHYEQIEQTRRENYSILHEKLGALNRLRLSGRPGTFMYPLLLENGAEIRKRLQKKNIYIPTLWPDVLQRCETILLENKLADNILPLPIDQRYGIDDMDFIAQQIKSAISLSFSQINL